MWRCCAYQENMKELFNEITTGNPNPTLEDFKIKRQTLLTDVGGEWYLINIRNNKTPINKPILSNKYKE